MNDILSRIFDNEARLKLLRFLVLNDKKFYSSPDLSNRTGLSVRQIEKEAGHLKKAGVAQIKKVAVFEGKNRKKVWRRAVSVDARFRYLPVFKDLFVAINPLSPDTILKRLSKSGRVKLVVTSGVFLENPDSRLDLLVVGDRLNKGAIDRIMRSFELTLGRELRYALLETSDFNYRLSIYDRLLRDVFDYPHRKLLNRIGF